MLQIRSAHGFHSTRLGLQHAAETHGGRVLAVGEVGSPGAIALTLCFSDLYAPLLDADIRFAAFLPLRVALCEQPSGVFLESMSPRECCRILHRPDLEPAATRLEDHLRAVMEQASRPTAMAAAAAAAPHLATEDQVNMRAALPQRIDCHGTKVEELAGTGAIDSQGG